MKFKKISISILCVIFSFLSLAKNEVYQYTAKLSTVVQDTVYKIQLTPMLLSIANNDLSDVRIYNNKNQQIPFVLYNNTNRRTDQFISIKPTVSNQHKKTIVSINNTEKKLYSGLTLLVANADVHKNCKVEGSNDNQKWFVISEFISLDLIGDNGKGFNFYEIKFPSINYSTIKITIDDSLSAPINIKDAGIFQYQEATNKMYDDVSNYQSTTTENAKNKTTEIKIKSTHKLNIDKIQFHITSPRLYNRVVTIYKNAIVQRKNKIVTERVDLCSFILSSNTSNIFENINISESECTIEIKNDDNLPLLLDKISFYQEQKFIIAELSKNNQYTITAGDKSLQMPNYDLNYFSDYSNQNLLTVSIENEKIQNTSSDKNAAQLPFYQQKIFLWLSIILASIVLLFFSITLLKQTNKK